MNNFFIDLEKIQDISNPTIPDDIANLNLDIQKSGLVITKPPLSAYISKEAFAQRLRELHLGLKATYDLTPTSSVRPTVDIMSLEVLLMNKQDAKVESEFTFI